MILVLAGTGDGRAVAAAVTRAGYKTLVSVVSRYGQKLAEEDSLTVNAAPLDEAGMIAAIRDQGVRAVIDATHPYAAQVSQNAMSACHLTGVKYLRYERLATPLPQYDKLSIAESPAQAAKLAAALGKVVFLTVGSRNLKVFKAEPLLAGNRLIARILPEAAVLAECQALGFEPRDLVAVQGPFSHEFNVALFRQFASEVIVTKNSGEEGGADTKFSAAMELGLPLIVIDRPRLEYGNIVHNAEDVIKFLKEELP